jgi:hypothetical protein
VFRIFWRFPSLDSLFHLNGEMGRYLVIEILFLREAPGNISSRRLASDCFHSAEIHPYRSRRCKAGYNELCSICRTSSDFKRMACPIPWPCCAASAKSSYPGSFAKTRALAHLLEDRLQQSGAVMAQAAIPVFMAHLSLIRALVAQLILPTVWAQSRPSIPGRDPYLSALQLNLANLVVGQA